uniref:Uncharacterized protein n=1 Tax=Glossina brevipalpis TaxID=37001 RepID=A0A1A9WXT7_9MUSC
MFEQTNTNKTELCMLFTFTYIFVVVIGPKEQTHKVHLTTTATIATTTVPCLPLHTYAISSIHMKQSRIKCKVENNTYLEKFFSLLSNPTRVGYQSLNIIQAFIDSIECAIRRNLTSLQVKEI